LKTFFESYLSLKIICIDPGHQGSVSLNQEPIEPVHSRTKEKAGGTKGILSGVPEYQIAPSISLKLKELLEKKGYKVIMTGETNQINISNEERAQIANRVKADITRLSE